MLTRNSPSWCDDKTSANGEKGRMRSFQNPDGREPFTQSLLLLFPNTPKWLCSAYQALTSPESGQCNHSWLILIQTTQTLFQLFEKAIKEYACTIVPNNEILKYNYFGGLIFISIFEIYWYWSTKESKVKNDIWNPSTVAKLNWRFISSNT